MKKPDTYFLITALKDGDLSALERVYKMYYSKLYGFSKKFDSVTMEPDDFVQQTFLKLWDNRSQLKEDVLLDKQIFVICRNLILTNLKREARNVPQIEEKYFPEHEEADISEKSRVLEKMHVLIQGLPKKRKDVFLLHRIHNLTYEEIAQSLDISKKTIANHIYLAHNSIKEELRKTDFNK